MKERELDPSSSFCELQWRAGQLEISLAWFKGSLRFIFTNALVIDLFIFTSYMSVRLHVTLGAYDGQKRVSDTLEMRSVSYELSGVG